MGLKMLQQKFWPFNANRETTDENVTIRFSPVDGSRFIDSNDLLKSKTFQDQVEKLRKKLYEQQHPEE